MFADTVTELLTEDFFVLRGSTSERRAFVHILLIFYSYRQSERKRKSSYAMFPFGSNGGPFGGMQQMQGMQQMMNGMMSQMMQDPFQLQFQRQMQVRAQIRGPRQSKQP